LLSEVLILKEEALNVVEHALFDETITITKYEELMLYLRTIDDGERVIVLLS
jgi:hypothetical protein